MGAHQPRPAGRPAQRRDPVGSVRALPGCVWGLYMPVHITIALSSLPLPPPHQHHPFPITPPITPPHLLPVQPPPGHTPTCLLCHLHHLLCPPPPPPPVPRFLYKRALGQLRSSTTTRRRHGHLVVIIYPVPALVGSPSWHQQNASYTITT